MTPSLRASAQRWKPILAAGVAAIALGMTGEAHALDAFVTSSAPLEAGPSPDYPQIATLEAGAPVAVYGCLNGWDWCDVSFEGYRGWFDGQLLAVPYQGERVPVFDFGPQIGVAVTAFSFDSYWEEHYRGRPFFTERERYAHIQPPPPRPHEGRPGSGAHPVPGPAPAAAPRPEMGRPGEPSHAEAARPGEPPNPEHAPRPQPASHPEPQAQHPQPHPQSQPGPAPHPAPPGHPPESKPAEHPDEHHD